MLSLLLTLLQATSRHFIDKTIIKIRRIIQAHDTNQLISFQSFHDRLTNPTTFIKVPTQTLRKTDNFTVNGDKIDKSLASKGGVFPDYSTGFSVFVYRPDLSRHNYCLLLDLTVSRLLYCVFDLYFLICFLRCDCTLLCFLHCNFRCLHFLAF